MLYRQIEWIDPIEAADRLVGLPGLALLDSAMAHPSLGRFSYLAADPFGVFVVRDGAATWNGAAEAGAPLDALRARLDACRCEPVPGLPPFQGGAIGAFAYELGWMLEGRPLPLAGRSSTHLGVGRDLPSPLAGEGARRADEGSLERGRFAERKCPSPSDPSSGASRHLLPQGEKGAPGSICVNTVGEAGGQGSGSCRASRLAMKDTGTPTPSPSPQGGGEPVGPAREGDDIHLAFHDVVVAFDHEERACWLMASGLPTTTPEARAERAEARLAAFATRLACRRRVSGAASAPDPRLVWRPTISRETYHANVERVREYIRAGDIYQANIAQRFVAPLPECADPWRLYQVLREKNPAPFAAYLDCGARKILSTSPELFLRTDGRRVETRPIKGTARRDADPAADRAAGAALLASRKDRAENVMIVDLLRNDLSKVCVPESVDVPLLCGLESYAGLHHLVSAVTGELRSGADALDLLAACFPGGSITGAPKLRAMEIIADIEGGARGTYCGAIGALGFDGGMVLNIAIRTLVVDGDTIELATGGGITMLSDPDAEYEETLTKAHRLLDAFAAPPEAGA